MGAAITVVPESGQGRVQEAAFRVCVQSGMSREGVRDPCSEARKHRLLRESCPPQEAPAPVVWEFLALDCQQWGQGMRRCLSFTLWGPGLHHSAEWVLYCRGCE